MTIIDNPRTVYGPYGDFTLMWNCASDLEESLATALFIERTGEEE